MVQVRPRNRFSPRGGQLPITYPQEFCIGHMPMKFLRGFQELEGPFLLHESTKTKHQKIGAVHSEFATLLFPPGSAFTRVAKRDPIEDCLRAHVTTKELVQSCASRLLHRHKSPFVTVVECGGRSSRAGQPTLRANSGRSA